MLNMTQFEKKYQNEIKTIAKIENVTFEEARQMLIFSCRLKEEGIHSVGEVMDFGKVLDESFDFLACLDDFRQALGLMGLPTAA